MRLEVSLPARLIEDAQSLTRTANGITLAGFKFMTIKAESDEVAGRKGVRTVLRLTAIDKS
jgi:hypothetical protein